MLFPKTQYPAEVCSHKNGADVHISDCTDTVQREPRWAIEYFCYKNNARVGAYIGQHYCVGIYADYLDAKAIEMSGVFRYDMYLLFQGTGTNPLFTSNDAEFKIKLEWFKNLLNRDCSAVSFAGGNVSYANTTKNYVLSGRNSAPATTGDTGDDNYGKVGSTFLGIPNLEFTIENYKSRANTTRWYDQPLTMPQLATKLQDTIDRRGWFQNFEHWHNLSSSSRLLEYDTYLQTLKSTVASSGKKAYFGSPGEALEYMAFRTFVTKVSCFSSAQTGNVVLSLKVKDAFYQNTLNTPLSVKIDLSTSTLANKNIMCVNGEEIISLGSNIYIINVPFVKSVDANKVISIEIIEGVQEYFSEVQPTITINKVSDVATITTDVETIITVFVKAKGALDNTYTKYTRILTYSKSHILSGLNFTTYDYAVGVSNKFKILNSQTF